MSNSLDFQNVCRICLQNVTESIDLISGSAESLEILEKISVCFLIIINSDKYLSCIICKECIKELDNANNFRIKCITINQRFKDYCQRVLKGCNEPVAGNNLELREVCQPPVEDDTNCESYEAETVNIRKFKCDLCNKELKSIKSLSKHIACMHEKRRHVGKVSGFGAARRYHCTFCFYSSPHSQTLVNHIRRHNGERPYKCECGKSFTQASSLTAHRKSHSTTSHFTCSQCGKQFKHASSLKTHLRVHDKGGFRCAICQKLLKSKQSLCAHMKRHYKVYDYNCEDCGDRFITSAELCNHRIKHSTEKKMKCHMLLCDYSTNTKKCLVMHLRRHLGDKRIKCNFCDKVFYTKSELRRHMRVHTLEKPFVCRTCSQKFTYSPSLNKHMETVHGVHYKWGDAKGQEIRMNKLV